MSLTELAEFLTDTVTVEAYVGKTGDGTVRYAAPVIVPCSIERRARFVRNLDGEQIVSSATVTADLAWTEALTPLARVTLDGRPTHIVTVAIDGHDDLFDGIEAVTAYLQ